MFACVSGLVVLGAAIARWTGIYPPYWVGSTLGFGLIVLASIDVGNLIGGSQRLARSVATVAIVTICEIVGVSTGWPFGAYRYTELWQPYVSLPGGRLFPLALPLTWFILAGASALACRHIGGRGWPFVAGLFLALVDVALEPVLIGPVGFWRWDAGAPPLQNYLAWALIGTLVAPILVRSKPKTEVRRRALWLLGIVLAATAIVGLSHGEKGGWLSLLPLLAVGLLLRVTPNDQPSASLPGHVGPGPLKQDEHLVAKADQVEDMNAEPDKPSKEP